MRLPGRLLAMAVLVVCLIPVCGFGPETAQVASVALDTDVIVTAAKVHAPLAALRGGERFPKGAQLLLVHDLGAKGTLLHNVSTDTGHWIAVKWRGPRAIGTGLASGSKWTRQASDGRRNAWLGRVIYRRTTGGCTLGCLLPRRLTS
jgi:hypothetical protein